MDNSTDNWADNWVEPIWDKLSWVEPSWAELSQVEPSWAKLSQVEPSWTKVGQNWMSLYKKDAKQRRECDDWKAVGHTWWGSKI